MATGPNHYRIWVSLTTCPCSWSLHIPLSGNMFQPQVLLKHGLSRAAGLLWENQLCVCPNQKPWRTKEVQSLLNERDTALRSGDDAQHTSAMEKRKIEDHLGSNNTRQVWRVHHKSSNVTVAEGDASLAENFFACFEVESPETAVFQTLAHSSVTLTEERHEVRHSQSGKSEQSGKLWWGSWTGAEGLRGPIGWGPTTCVWYASCTQADRKALFGCPIPCLDKHSKNPKHPLGPHFYMFELLPRRYQTFKTRTIRNF